MGNFNQAMRDVLQEIKIKGLGKKQIEQWLEKWERIVDDRSKPRNMDQVERDLNDTDPTTQKEYARWIFITYINRGITYWHDLRALVRPALERFEQLKEVNVLQGQEKDLNRYKNLKDLQDTLDKYEDVMSQEERRKIQSKEKERAHKESVLSKYGPVLVVQPKTYFAMQYWGRSSKGSNRWCTVTHAAAYRDYAEKGKLFILIDKNEKWLLNLPDKVDAHLEMADHYNKHFKIRWVVENRPRLIPALEHLLGKAITKVGGAVDYLILTQDPFSENERHIMDLAERGDLDKYEEVFSKEFTDWFKRNAQLILLGLAAKKSNLDALRGGGSTIKDTLDRIKMYHGWYKGGSKLPKIKVSTPPSSDKMMYVLTDEGKAFEIASVSKITRYGFGGYGLVKEVETDLEGFIENDPKMDQVISYVHNIPMERIRKYRYFRNLLDKVMQMDSRQVLNMAKGYFIQFLKGKADFPPEIETKHFQLWAKSAPSGGDFVSIKHMLNMYHSVMWNSMGFDGSEVTLYG